MNDVVAVTTVLVLSAVIAFALQARYPNGEGRIILASYAMHVAFTFANLWVVYAVYSGVGDMMMYHGVGSEIANLMRTDPAGVVPQVVRMFFHLEFALSSSIRPTGNSGTITALAALGCLFLGNSLYAVSLLFSFASFLGKVAIYQALRETLPGSHRPVLMFAALLVPSVVFWSSGIIKESVAIVGVGVLSLGAVRVLAGRRRSLWLFGLGVLVVQLMKPYILVGAGAAVGAYLYWRRSTTRGHIEIRPVSFAVACALAVLSVWAVGRIDPDLSLENIGQQTAFLQAAGTKASGGSNYVIGDPSQTSIIGHLAYAPLGLLTALFRPSLLDAHNAPALVNALESTFFTVLFARAAWVTFRNRLVQPLVTMPILVYCIVFVAVLGVGVGLTSANLGTLSRYRAPFVPFYVATLLVLGARPARTRADTAPALRTAPRRLPGAASA